MAETKGKLVVFTAPSGTGKSTIAKAILADIPTLKFSVSATTRPKRDGEEDGREYYFMTKDAFEALIAKGGFIEHSRHFDNYYGTLKSEAEKVLNAGNHLLLDLDVDGALNVKKIYGSRSLLMFIKPPSLEALRERLLKRKTESEEKILMRLARADYELSLADQFDVCVVNDDLDKAIAEIKRIIQNFLNS
ncbi:MAG: guanylate kinase [Chloroherpetonaceae bacterium]|nr:guanylate kinase [Chloroherpetonaceae bacterium]MDW8438641.1 guanylate kinase [Chloroherpetonaceae bacterium]